jgi:hypothetical protein
MALGKALCCIAGRSDSPTRLYDNPDCPTLAKLHIIASSKCADVLLGRKLSASDVATCSHSTTLNHVSNTERLDMQAIGLIGSLDCRTVVETSMCTTEPINLEHLVDLGPRPALIGGVCASHLDTRHFQAIKQADLTAESMVMVPPKPQTLCLC